jgi:5-methylcytosine-specific restriction endonuclease McrA
MTNLTKTICALYGCDKPVTNWRISCCSRAHQLSYAGKKANGTENQPNKTKEDLAPYYRQYAIEKQSRVKHATPFWGDKEKIKEIYVNAAKLTKLTGIPHEVDHIIPLTNKIVCGLHNEFNLRIISRQENRSKRNKLLAE